MNQSKAFLTSFIFGLAAMALVYFYISQKEQAIKTEFGTEVPVVVAARDINEMEEIRFDMLKTINVPKKFAQPFADSDTKTFEGAVAGAPIQAGEQVLMTKVLLKGAETGLATQVAITRRAISMPISEVTGVTKLMRPGDRVDLIANIPYQSETGQDFEVKTILQNVHVLAVGELVQNQIPQKYEKDPITGNRRAVNLRGSRNFSTVTLEVSPEEAQSLVYVMQTGTEMFVTLRNPVDRMIASIPTTTVDEVLGPNSKKAEKERARRRPIVTAPSAPVRPSPPNPYKLGGGSLAN